MHICYVGHLFLSILKYEVQHAGKYVKSDVSLDVKKDIGLTDDDMSAQYQYTKDIVSDDGKLKGTTWQATVQ